MRSGWMVIGCAILLTGGCAPARPTISEAQLRRLPPVERRALREREADIHIAESRESAAISARQDAGRYREAVGRQLAAAEQRVRSARAALDRARRDPDPRRAALARRELRLGEAELRTVRARRTYAEELVALADADIAGRRAEVELARSRHELDELDMLQRFSEARNEDRASFLNAVERARRRAAERAREVDVRQAAVGSARSRWYARVNELDSLRAQGPAPAGRPAPE